MAGKPIDLMGQRFGRLVVIERAGTSKNGQVIWRCLCDCGKEADVLSISLRRGLTRSCGCLSREKVSERTTARNTIHGARHTKLYNTWRGMRERCENPSHKSYSDYGGRGISVCAEWQDFTAFQKWALASGYKRGRIHPRSQAATGLTAMATMSRLTAAGPTRNSKAETAGAIT